MGPFSPRLPPSPLRQSSSEVGGDRRGLGVLRPRRHARRRESKLKDATLRIKGGDHQFVLGPRPAGAVARGGEQLDAALAADGVRPLLIVQHVGSRDAEHAALQEQFAAYAASLARQIPEYRDFIIGNGEPQPLLAAAVRPERRERRRARLLALRETYDALKAVSDDIRIIGGALAPRGETIPMPRGTHSPTRFIRDLGTYYRQVEGMSR